MLSSTSMPLSRRSVAFHSVDSTVESAGMFLFSIFLSHISYRTGQAKEFKHTQGRWPVKSAKIVIGLLENLVANAEGKSLDVDRLVLTHVQCNEAQRGRRRTYRAHGRINAYMSTPCHVELFAEEKEDNVERPKASGKKPMKFTKAQLSKKKLVAQN